MRKPESVELLSLFGPSFHLLSVRNYSEMFESAHIYTWTWKANVNFLIFPPESAFFHTDLSVPAVVSELFWT